MDGIPVQGEYQLMARPAGLLGQRYAPAGKPCRRLRARLVPIEGKAVPQGALPKGKARQALARVKGGGGVRVQRAVLNQGQVQPGTAGKARLHPQAVEQGQLFLFSEYLAVGGELAYPHPDISRPALDVHAAHQLLSLPAEGEEPPGPDILPGQAAFVRYLELVEPLSAAHGQIGPGKSPVIPLVQRPHHQDIKDCGEVHNPNGNAKLHQDHGHSRRIGGHGDGVCAQNHPAADSQPVHHGLLHLKTLPSKKRGCGGPAPQSSRRGPQC